MELEKVEEGIYIYYWVNCAKLETEANDAFMRLQALNKGQPYVAIINVEKLTRLPTEIGYIRRSVKQDIAEGLIGYVICGASRIMESFVKPLAALAPTLYRFAPDQPSAIEEARRMLKE